MAEKEKKKTLASYLLLFHRVRSLIQAAVDFHVSLFVSLLQFSQTVIGTLDGTLFALFRFHVNVDADSDGVARAHAYDNALLKISSVKLYIKFISDALAGTVIPPKCGV